jgi:hypothetical protein
MWNKHPIEEKLRTKLVEQFGEDIGQNYFTKYTSARDYLVDNVYDQIRAAEPDLTDHSAKHIRNVFTNVQQLLNGEIESLSGIELYCLCIMILFHDVGNIKGREGHNKNISEIYNNARKKEATFNQERRIIISAAEAHCGKTKQGDKDTLKYVEEIENIDGHKIRLRQLAALLRFADELAEGPQRTSQFMIEKNLYGSDSILYHKYATITRVFIDKGNNRVVLSYDIDVSDKDLGSSEELEKLFKFAVERVGKLDEERRYCKYYTNFLGDYKTTEVSINFTFNGANINDVEQTKFSLNDHYPIPGQDSMTFSRVSQSIEPAIDISEIIKKINSSNAA